MLIFCVVKQSFVEIVQYWLWLSVSICNQSVYYINYYCVVIRSLYSIDIKKINLWQIYIGIMFLFL